MINVLISKICFRVASYIREIAISELELYQFVKSVLRIIVVDALEV